jgi:hypothetical protein
MAQQSDWRNIVTVQAVSRPDTTAMFGKDGGDDNVSPIDVFISNTNSLNTLYVGHLSGQVPLPAELGTLVLLGYMSAVESYFRAVLRGAIRIDRRAQRSVELMQVTYGAAVHHRPELLPEALFEGTSFAGKKGAIDFVKSVLGLTGNLPATIDSVLPPFLAICELRHCCVHRFGKLGSQNAIRLGLGEHSTLIERPFQPAVDDLQEIGDVLRTFTKAINNWLWSELIKRTVRQRPQDTDVVDWSWTLKEDEVVFRRYHTLFASVTDSPPSPSAEEAYNSFAASCGPAGAPFVDALDEE